jgi:hypothetical protein
MHKSAPYKISPVHIAFARKLLTAGASLRCHEVRKSIYNSELAENPRISTVGIFRALVQCEREKSPSG